MSNVNTVVFTIVVILFVFVTVIGFADARWRRAEDMLHLNEWGLGGRSYGTFIGWFLLGGDLYTAYTFIAVPALVFAQLDFATLALGSALALFLYPHTITGALATKRRDVVKRNMALLPTYSVLLACIALFGYMALTDKTTAAEVKKAGNTQLAVPYLLQHMFPSWFTGIAFAAIIIGALVPAAIMAIAAANLFTRNIFKEFFKPDASPRLETRVSQWASLVVKFGALAFAVWLPHTFAINLLALGVVVGHRVRAQRLHRAHRGGHQHRPVGGADADHEGRQGPRGRRRDAAAPVHRRPRGCPGARARGRRGIRVRLTKQPRVNR